MNIERFRTVYKRLEVYRAREDIYFSPEDQGIDILLLAEEIA
jgi:hypothetical protein